MDDFNRLMLLWTLEYTMSEIEKNGAAFGVPVAPIRSVSELVKDAQLAYRNFFVEIEHPAAGTLKYPGAPYKLSATPWEIQNRAPLLGENNEDVYCKMLGYSRSDLVKMRQAGVI
jgi:crotonobetainyl-CoA:carnitine CoA-transferase CaiB-like acyl-CoA transferase